MIFPKRTQRPVLFAIEADSRPGPPVVQDGRFAGAVPDLIASSGRDGANTLLAGFPATPRHEGFARLTAIQASTAVDDSAKVAFRAIRLASGS